MYNTVFVIGLTWLMLYATVLTFTDDCPSISHGRKALQSTFHGPLRKPGKAVDGNYDARMYMNSCSHTQEGDTSPWWGLDLGQVRVITMVRIYNRADCCGSRLHDFNVGISDVDPQVAGKNVSSPTYTLCKHFPGNATNGQIIDMHCMNPNGSGRFVIIHIPGTGVKEILSLCEVDIFSYDECCMMDEVATCSYCAIGVMCHPSTTAGTSIGVHKTQSQVECLLFCRQLHCKSLHFNHETSDCILYNKVVPASEQQENLGWTFYRVFD